jgi:hypothetical protein
MITDFCDEPLEEAHTTLWGLEMFNIFLADFRKRESLHRSVVEATEDCRVWQVVK